MAVCGIGNDRAGLYAGESTAPYSGFSNLKTYRSFPNGSN